MAKSNIIKGDSIIYAGSVYEVAEIKDFPHGRMIGIYDESSSKHIDYISLESVQLLQPCYNCQGGGCPVCSGYGTLTT